MVPDGTFYTTHEKRGLFLWNDTKQPHFFIIFLLYCYVLVGMDKLFELYRVSIKFFNLVECYPIGNVLFGCHFVYYQEAPPSKFVY